MSRTDAREARVPRSSGTGRHPHPHIDLHPTTGEEIDLTQARLPPGLAPIAAELTDAARLWVDDGAAAVAVCVDDERHWLAGRPCDRETTPTVHVALGAAATLEVFGAGPGAGHVELTASVLGRLLAQSLEVDEVTDELIAAQDQLVALRELTAPTIDTLDRASVAERIAEDAVRLTGGTAAALITADGVCAVAGAHDARTELVEAIGRGDHAAARPGEEDVDDTVVAPIDPRGELLAVRLRAGQGRRAAAREITGSLAAHASALLRLADLHEDRFAAARETRDAAIASTLIAHTLPDRHADAADIQVAVHRRPVSVGNGGYHGHVVSHRRSVFFAGRVSGAPLPAALAINAIVAAVSAAATRNRAGDAALILENVRRAVEPLLADSGLEASITIAACSEAGNLELAVAGEPTVVHRHGPHITRIGPTAPPLGGRHTGESGAAVALALGVGDALLLGSDLLTAPTDDARTGLAPDELDAILATSAGHDAERTVERLAAVFDRLGSPCAAVDDLTMMILTRR